MQGQRVTLGHGLQAIGVGDGQLAVREVPGADFLNAVCGEIEHEGAIRLESCGRAAIRTGDDHGLDGRSFFFRGSRAAKVQGSCGDFIISTQLFVNRRHVVQLHGVALGGHFRPGSVDHGEHAVFVCVVTQVLHAIGFKEEAISAIGVEGHGGGLIGAGNGNRITRLVGGRFVRHILRFRLILRLSFLFCFRALPGLDHLSLAQGEDCFRHEIQNGRLVLGIVHAIGVVAVHVHLGSGLHLGGIGIRLHLKHSMGSWSDGHGAVLIQGVLALGLRGQHETQAGIVAHLGPTARFNHVAVHIQLIILAAVQDQGHIHIETAVGLHHAGEIRAEELVIGHVIRVLVALVIADGVGTLGIGFLIGNDLTLFQCPLGFGNEIQHGGDIIGIIDTVRVVAVHVHLYGGLHLGGIGVCLHFKDCVRGGAGHDRTILIHGITALSLRGQHQAQACIVTHDSAAAGFDHIGIRIQGVCAVAIQINAHVHIETAVSLHHAGEVGAEELEVRHIVGVFIALVVAHGIGAVGIGFLIGDNCALRQSECRFRHKVQHGWLVLGIVHAIGIVAVHVHLNSGLHLRGIGVRLHFKHGVGGYGNGHRAVGVGDIGTFRICGQHQSKACIVTHLGPAAGFDHVGIHKQLIAAFAVQRQLFIHIEAAVGLDHT